MTIWVGVAMATYVVNATNVVNREHKKGRIMCDGLVRHSRGWAIAADGPGGIARGMRLGLAVILALCVSCGLIRRRGDTAFDRYSAQNQELAKRAEAMTFVPSCKKKKKDSRAQCGLLIDTIGSDEFYRRFSAQICQGAPGCSDRFIEMFLARCRLRYTKANPLEVSDWCIAYPEECKDLRAIELQFVLSHNRKVQVAYNKAHDRLRGKLREEYAQEEEEDRRRREEAWQHLAQGLQNVGNSMQGGKNCTSTVVGDQVYTRCDP